MFLSAICAILAAPLNNTKAWDLGGHEAVRYLWFDFLGDSQAIVFMVDGADKERLDEAHWELTELLSEVRLGGRAREDVPILYLLTTVVVVACTVDK